MDIYIVISRNTAIQDWTTVNVNSECYTSKEEAIEFCESRLNEEELEHDRKMKARNLRNWYEFYSKHYVYEIKVLKVR